MSIGFRRRLMPGEHRETTRYSVTFEALGWFGAHLEEVEASRFERLGMAARLLRWNSEVASLARMTYVVEVEWAVRPQGFAEATGLPVSQCTAYDEAQPTVLTAHYERRLLVGEDAPERLGARAEGSVRFEAPCPDCGEPCEWVAYAYPPVPGWCRCQGGRPE